MKFTPEIKKQIAEATGLTYLADNLEKLDGATEGQKVADMLRYYCPTAEKLAIVDKQALPAIKTENPEFTYDDETPIEPVEKVTLTIIPTPTDAQVKIGNAIGATAEVEKDKPVTYEVSKEGYKTVSETVTLTEDKTIEVTLEEATEPVEKVTLTIVAEPTDAIVKINDIEQTSIEVDKGTAVKIEVSKEGYKTQLNVAYVVNKTETLTVTLEAEAPAKPEKPEGVVEPASTANASCTYVNDKGNLFTGSGNKPTNMQVATDGFIELALGPGLVKKVDVYPESESGKYVIELAEGQESNLRFCVGVKSGVITDLYDVQMLYSNGTITKTFNLVKSEAGYNWAQVEDPSYIITDSAFGNGNVCQNITRPSWFFENNVGDFTTTMTATPKFDDGQVVTCQIETVVSSTKPDHSVYEGSMTEPLNLTAGVESPVDVTVSTKVEGKAGYDKVRIFFETTEKPGDLKFVLINETGQEFEFINNGSWGPETGFALPVVYNATTTLKLMPSVAGTYHIKTRLVNLEDSSDIMVVEGDLNVAEASQAQPAKARTSKK